MGKAFVAKLAKAGARDPEALAAWIGRKKHGAAFGKLAKAGKEKASAKPAARQQRQMTPGQAAERARKASAAVADHDAPKPTTRNGRPGYIAPGSPEFDATTSARLHRKAQTEREAAAKAYADAGNTQKAQHEQWAADQHAAGAAIAEQIAKDGGTSDARSKLPMVSSSVQQMDAATAETDRAVERGREQAGSQQPGTSNSDERDTPQSGFTEAEERQLAATASQTARMNMGQLQAYEEAYKPSATRTRREALQHEAVRREIARRHDAVREGMNQVRKMNQGAGKGSFMMGQRPEGVSGQRLRRMSDEDVNRNLQLAVALMKASEEQGAPMSREDKTLLYDVTSALRRENSRRNLAPVR